MEKFMKNDKHIIKLKRLHPDAIIPNRTHTGDYYDLYAVETIHIPYNKPTLVKTGWAFELPEGYGLKLYNRSSGAYKKMLSLSNSVAVIDNGYRGELLAVFHSLNVDGTIISAGEKVAQFTIEKITPEIDFIEVDELSDTSRQAGGFGSTGK